MISVGYQTDMWITHLIAKLLLCYNKIIIVFQKGYTNQEKLNYFLEEYYVCGRMLTNLEKSLNC